MQAIEKMQYSLQPSNTAFLIPEINNFNTKNIIQLRLGVHHPHNDIANHNNARYRSHTVPPMKP